jgi:transposase-like protein
MGTKILPGLSEGKAARMMVALRGGGTLNKFGVRAPRLEAYFDSHPEYALEARPLIEANAKAAQLRKAAGKRSRTHCSRGHLFTLETTRYRKDQNDPRRECKICESTRALHGNAIKPGCIEQVRAMLKKNARISSFTGFRQGSYVMSHRTFKRLRQEDSEIDKLASNVIERAQHLRLVRYRNQIARDQSNDYQKIRAMLPANYPDKDAVISFIIEDILTGVLKREDVPARLKLYIAAEGKFASTIKFPKFGPHRLRSTDAQLFEVGGATLGDTAVDTLWD